MLNQQAKPEKPINHPIQITYTIGKPDNRRRDIFNLEKGMGDLLVSQKILKDDSLIERGIMQWTSDFDGVDVEIVRTEAILARSTKHHTPLA